MSDLQVADPRPVPTGQVKLYEWEAKGADYALVLNGTRVRLSKWDRPAQTWYGESEETVAFDQLLKLAGVELSYTTASLEAAGGSSHTG